MITLHHLENSVSARIVWLLEETGTEYELKRYGRSPVGLASDEYKALHPAGTAPVITDGDLTLAETSAVIDYILDQHPESNLRPAVGSPMRTQYLYWFHASQGSFAPMQLMKFIFNMMATKSPFFIRPLVAKITGQANAMITNPRLNALLGAMEKDLGKTKWFAGDEFTAADIILGQNLLMMAIRQDFSQYPNINRFLQQIKAREAFQRAEEKVGTLDLAALNRK